MTVVNRDVGLTASGFIHSESDSLSLSLSLSLLLSLSLAPPVSMRLTYLFQDGDETEAVRETGL